MRAGREIRAQAAIRNAPPCDACGHEMHFHRELQPTRALVGGEVVETPHPDYAPLVFFCHHEACSCRIDRR